MGSEVGSATPQVKHLEVSSASMAEDLCRKSAIIETYVMDSRIGQCPVPGPHYSSNLSPAPSFPTVQCQGFSPLSWNSAKLLTRPQLTEGIPGQAHTCVSFYSVSYLGSSLFSGSLSSFHSVFSSVSLCLLPPFFSLCYFLVFLPLISSPYLFLCPIFPSYCHSVPVCNVLSQEIFFFKKFFSEIFFLCMCILLGSLSFPHFSPSSPLLLSSLLFLLPSPSLFLFLLSFKPSSLPFFPL